MRRPTDAATLRVDPISCRGIAMCAHVAPQVVTLDSWNYPVLAHGSLTGPDRRAARAAVAACPRRALFLEPVRESS